MKIKRTGLFGFGVALALDKNEWLRCHTVSLCVQVAGWHIKIKLFSTLYKNLPG